MARKKADQEKLFNIGKAFGGGIVSEVVSDLIAQQAPEIIQKNPKLTELIPAGIGGALVYFSPMDGKLDAVGYGMLGAAGAGLSDDIIGGMNGFNRLTMNGNDADEYAEGRDYMENLMQEGFEDRVEMTPTMGGYSLNSQSYSMGH